MKPGQSIAALLAHGTRVLRAAGCESPRLEAELLLADALDQPRSALYAWPAREVQQAGEFADRLERRRRGEPVAYITGKREFWSLDLAVTPHTLIPRPETELLVELALARLTATASVADLGTGSGAIALAIAKERPQARVVATDVSLQALAVARCNADRHGLRVEFRFGAGCAGLGDEGLRSRFRVIVSNPPYIAADSPYLQHGDVRFEPRLALLGGTDGLQVIRAIAEHAGDYLLPGGRLLLEHGFDQGEPVRALLREHGYGPVKGYKDAAGIDRVAEGVKP